MFSKETATLLHKSLQNLPHILCNRSLKHDIDDVTAMIFPRSRLAVVDDAATAQAFGDQVFRALKGRFDCLHVTLPGTSAADGETAEYVREQTRACDALVAIGSGTINDLCKYASFQDGKPYIVFPTAASMNGYCSANASITLDGAKKTCAAHMPKAVFCDLSVIAAAPSRLSKSGLGDSLARPTAQADWLLSHLLLHTPYDDTPFALLAPLEPHLFENARGIAAADPQSIELLLQVLVLSGLGMTIAGGSYPASQGEHMIAHAWHSRASRNPITFHGEEIGITTLTTARMQENLLKKRPVLRSAHFPHEAITELFGSRITKEAEKAYEAKQTLMTQAKLDSRLHGNDGAWEAIAQRIEPIMLPSTKIHAILKAAQAPDTPEALGWNAEAYETSITYARFLRDRFTFLDLQ